MDLIEIKGRGGIVAKIIADSIHPVTGKRITSYELTYPRYIHSEVMTHRVFSRNAASSRAIPITKMIDQLRAYTAMPVHWGKNQAGMQADNEVDHETKIKAIDVWLRGCEKAIETALELADLGIHKQIANRGLEPYYMMKTIVTSTEYDNWDLLRDHKDAQPEIKELAFVMKIARIASVPKKLAYGEWHLPYINYYGGQYYSEDDLVSLEDAIKISVSCCAQVSYRKNDTSLEKARDIFIRLVEAEPAHFSPFEHQATPMTDLFRDDPKFKSNLNDWLQYRKIMESKLNIFP